jgi:hypothetical protein
MPCGDATIGITYCTPPKLLAVDDMIADHTTNDDRCIGRIPTGYRVSNHGDVTCPSESILETGGFVSSFRGIMVGLGRPF